MSKPHMWAPFFRVSSNHNLARCRRGDLNSLCETIEEAACVAILRAPLAQRQQRPQNRFGTRIKEKGAVSEAQTRPLSFYRESAIGSKAVN